MSATELGVLVKELREKKGWSVYRLEKESNIARNWLEQIESGNARYLRDVTYVKLAKALGVDPIKLFIAMVGNNHHCNC